MQQEYSARCKLYFPCVVHRKLVHVLQGMGEYLVQGKHFAATQGRGHFAGDEVLDLTGMYTAACTPQTVSEVLNKVCALIIRVQTTDHRCRKPNQ